MAFKEKNAFVSGSCFTSGQRWFEVSERSHASLCVMFTPLLPILILPGLCGCQKQLYGIGVCLKGVYTCAMHTVTCGSALWDNFV